MPVMLFSNWTRLWSDFINRFIKIVKKCTWGTAEIRVKIDHSDTFFPRRYFSEIFVT